MIMSYRPDADTSCLVGLEFDGVSTSVAIQVLLGSVVSLFFCRRSTTGNTRYIVPRYGSKYCIVNYR